MSPIVLLLAFLGLANGFALAPRPARVSPRSMVTMGAVEEAAMTCLEDGCSLDTLDDLLKELKAEASENVANDTGAKERQKQVLMMIGALSVLSPEKQLSEIEKIVRGAARSFEVTDDFDFKGPAIGYTGKPGTTTTAGKSLN